MDDRSPHRAEALARNEYTNCMSWTATVELFASSYYYFLPLGVKDPGLTTKLKKLIKLEIWGRTQLEAARRRKADCKYNLGGFRECKNLRGQHP